MTTYPKDYRYSKEHEWLKTDGEHYVLGITAYAAEQLGDIVHVEFPEVGAEFGASEAFGAVESVKSVSDIYLPVAAKVTEVNELLLDNPGLINEEPHADGWLIKLIVDDKAEVKKLMDAEAYQAYLAEVI